MLFINVPHPFSIVLKRFYCFQEVLNKIPKPIENNRKWVWWVYNYNYYYYGKQITNMISMGYSMAEWDMTYNIASEA